jgi:NitT/TauT family transport system substrate-binding protein
MATRRAILKTAGASMVTALVHPSNLRAADAEPLTFITPFGFIPDFLEMMNMVSGGYLKQEGFNPKLLGAQGTATALAQVIAGAASFARITAIDEFVAVAKGAPLLCVSTLYHGSNFHVVSLKAKPIDSVADMKGKTVGIVSVGGSTEQLLHIMLRSAGMTKDDVITQVVGNSPGVVEFIRQGRIDCFINSIGVVVALKTTNEPIVSWPTDRYAPMPSQIYVTTRDIADKKPEMIVRFLKALKASTDDMLHGDLAEIFQRASADFDIPGIKNMNELVSLIKFIMANPWMSEGKENLLRNIPELWQKADAEIRAAGIASVAQLNALYTNTFIDQALKD